MIATRQLLSYSSTCGVTRGRALHRISLREIAEGTGLSRRGVQNAVRRLERRRLVSVEKTSPTGVPRYQIHWPP